MADWVYNPTTEHSAVNLLFAGIWILSSRSRWETSYVDENTAWEALDLSDELVQQCQSLEDECRSLDVKVTERGQTILSLQQKIEGYKMQIRHMQQTLDFKETEKLSMLRHIQTEPSPNTIPAINAPIAPRAYYAQLATPGLQTAIVPQIDAVLQAIPEPQPLPQTNTASVGEVLKDEDVKEEVNIKIKQEDEWSEVKANIVPRKRQRTGD